VGSSAPLLFGPFRLDPEDECLRRGDQPVPLTPKAFAVLHLLASNPGRLVTKEELLETVWAHTQVSEAVLKTSVLDIRRALGDDPRAPRFIETMHRRGYRFIGLVRSAQGSPAACPTPGLVGRDGTLARLERLLESARQGIRQVAFVTGEVGIGKTAVAEAFLARLAGAPEIWTARGQCLEQCGAGEEYLPVLEALGRLCREPGREDLVALLASHAPTWLVQMPWLVGEERREALQRATLGASRDRMLRELAELLEALTVARTLVLLLEDLHWSDVSTLDLLAVLARRREAARLLVLGTYRPVDLMVGGHPLRAVHQELRLHRLCEDLPLQSLGLADVERYLAGRFPGHAFPPDLAQALERRTDGNPLFLVTVADALASQGHVVEWDARWELTVAIDLIEREVPETLRQVIERQIDRTAANDRLVLEAASVAGAEFSSMGVAAALEEDLFAVEDRLETLARRSALVVPAETRELPSGAPLGRYAFAHALYQHVLYDAMPAARRARFHRRIGDWAEAAYRPRVAEMAAELAVHFEQARDEPRAIRHRRQAAENALKRHANREALGHLEHALRLVACLPDVEANALRPAVQEHIGLVRRSMGDMGSAAADFIALAEWARDRGDAAWEAKALLYLASAHAWVDAQRALAASDRALALCQTITDPLVRAHVRGYAGYWRFTAHGWREEDARACAEAVEAMRAAGDRMLLAQHLLRLSSFQCARTEYRAACRSAEESLALAIEVGNAYDCLSSQYFRGRALFLLGDWGTELTTLRDALAMADLNGHRGWAQNFRLELAGLHIAAHDFAGAAALAEEEHARSSPLGHQTSKRFSELILALAWLGRGEFERARKVFRARLAAATAPQTICRLGRVRAHLGLAEAAIAVEDWPAAREHAGRLRELAGASGERTYLGLACALLTEAALGQQRWDAAEEHARDALRAVEGVEAPVAEWRVCGTVARLRQRRRRIREAARLRERSARVVRRLADSLAATPALQRSFLDAPTVRDVLDRA
jgi:DNA-binding winged helix-turn-helix (wHTH) protein